MTLGRKLQELRREKNWTQEELAEKTGVSRQALSRWESDAALPDTKNIIQLARLFGVSTDYLLLDSGEQRTGTQPRRFSTTVLGAAMLALGAAGILLFEILTPVFSYRHEVIWAGTGQSSVYTGMFAYIRYERLGWLLTLCLIAALAGAALLIAGVIRSRRGAAKS